MKLLPWWLTHLQHFTKASLFFTAWFTDLEHISILMRRWPNIVKEIHDHSNCFSLSCTSSRNDRNISCDASLTRQSQFTFDHFDFLLKNNSYIEVGHSSLRGTITCWFSQLACCSPNLSLPFPCFFAAKCVITIFFFIDTISRHVRQNNFPSLIDS